MHAARAGGLCAALAAAVVALAAAPVHAQRVGIDPRTGQVVQPPEEKAAAPSADASTSSEGLVEETGATPGQGVTVHLRGRFRSNLRVTRTPDGRLVEDCPPGTAP